MAISNKDLLTNKNTSYAYDPSGNKINVSLVNGVTTMADGSRLPAGYTVNTAGGIYKMGADGKGVKVDSHNTAPMEQNNVNVVSKSPSNPYSYNYDYGNQGNVGYINTKTGDNTVTTGSVYKGLTDDEYTAKGYTRVTDQEIIKMLQQGAASTSGFKTMDDWQKMLSDTMGYVTGAPTAEEIAAAQNRINQYSSYKDYSKPVWGQMTDPQGNSKSVKLDSSEWKQYEQSLLSDGKSSDNFYGSDLLPESPTLRSGRSMADLFGIKRDYDDILNKYTDAVNKKYANLDTEYGRTQDMYYDTVANNADVLMGTMRRGDRDAVRAGVSSGAQSAQEMAALLGVSADSAKGATELSQGRSDLVTQREAEKANVTKEALKYFNDLGINLATLSNSELNALMTGYAAQVATAGGIYNTDILAGVERDKITSQETIERARLENILTNTGLVNQGNLANTDKINAGNLAVEQERSSGNLASTTQQGLTSKEIAKMNATASSGSGLPKMDGLSNDEQIGLLFGIIEKNTPNPDTGFKGNQKLVDAANKKLQELAGIEFPEVSSVPIVTQNEADAFDRETERILAATPPHLRGAILQKRLTEKRNRVRIHGGGGRSF